MLPDESPERAVMSRGVWAWICAGFRLQVAEAGDHDGDVRRRQLVEARDEDGEGAVVRNVGRGVAELPDVPAGGEGALRSEREDDGLLLALCTARVVGRCHSRRGAVSANGRAADGVDRYLILRAEEVGDVLGRHLVVLVRVEGPPRLLPQHLLLLAGVHRRRRTSDLRLSARESASRSAPSCRERCPPPGCALFGRLGWARRSAA